MRLKKKSTSIGILGKILNAFSNSQKDTYSCDYINKKLEDDTGWLAMDTFQHNEYKWGFYRKKNGVVYIECRSGIPTIANSYVTVFTLPEGFRPQVGIPFTYHCVGGDISSQSGFVESNGNINVYSPLSGESASFSISFPVN